MSRRQAEETPGARLKRLRLAAGLSQRDLSEPGVSYAYISRIEAGARTPSVKALRKIAPKLGVTLEYLERGAPDEVEDALAKAGLHLVDLTEEERQSIERAASAWRRIGAYEAAVRVLRDRDRQMMEDLSGALDVIHERRRRQGELVAVEE